MAQTQDLQPPRVKYPITNTKEWGPPYWVGFHNNASLYPKNPSDIDKSQEIAHINYFITHLPCKNQCVDHAKEYIQKNPPDLSSKKTYFDWTIEFHNAVNEKTGDPERVNPDELLADEGPACETCKIPQAEDNNPPAPVANGATDVLSHDVNIRKSMEAYKAAAKQLVNDVCLKEGIEPPEMYFSKCIDGTDSSCLVNVITADGKKKQVAFYNPTQLADTIIHEVYHHRDAKQGKSISDADNPAANKYAFDTISKYFPYDTVSMDKNGNIAVAHDVVIRESVPIPTAATAASADPSTVVKQIYGQPNQFNTDPEDPRILDEFPHLKQTLMEIKKEELKGEIREFEKRGGFLAHFDKVYNYPAGLTGLKPEQLNILHTPTIIAAIAETVTGTFFAPLPRVLITSIFGIFLMLMGIGFHKKMTTRDIQFVQAMGAQMMWHSTIPSLNPKQARRIKKDFERMMDLGKNKNLKIGDIIETPDQDISNFQPREGIGVGFGNAAKGKPIPQGVDRIRDSVSEVNNPDYFENLSEQSELHLPRFTSRSHARFT